MASSTVPSQPSTATAPATAEKEQMSPEFYSALGSNYETAFGHDQGLLSFLQRLLPHLPDHSKVLDIGCGTGNPVATTLAAAGHHMNGIDISDEMVRLSRQAVPSGVFEVAYMQSYNPKVKPLGAVLSILSLFALDREAIEEQVAKWATWLCPGGILSIASIPAEDADVKSRSGVYDSDGMCARKVQFLFMGEITTLTLFTRYGWETLLRRNGFEVIDSFSELFVPHKEAKSDEEMHHFVIAKKA